MKIEARLSYFYHIQNKSKIQGVATQITTI